MRARLAGVCEPLVRARPGRSGLIPLPDGRDAFAARALLADAAERTLDARYYIWHDDMSGRLLFAALRRAADRGVRVRLLLDDNNTAGLDTLLAALDSHPNIEVRLFNAFTSRRWRMLGYVTDFQRLNRRMHNKSFTVDGHATIIGGRNVGDEYFDAGDAPWFVDLDVLAIGPVVRDVAEDFNRYWTSASSVPAAGVLPPASAHALAEVAAAAERVERDPAAAHYVAALATVPLVQDLLAGRLQFEWAATRLLSDDPAKGLGRKADAWLWPRLQASLGTPARALRLISPYFVPGKAGVQTLAAFARHGVEVSVLTNALEATDVPLVHAGYAKRRKALLEAGVALFELQRQGSRPATPRGARMRGSRPRSSASSLHAKTLCADDSRVFIGSFNLDPRSARLNTEMGFLIDSPVLANEIGSRFANDVPTRAYQVRLDAAGRLQWIDRANRQEVVHDLEPGTDLWRRLTLWLLARLPIEWLL